MYLANWDARLVMGAAPRVELVNTNLPYRGKRPYTRFAVPNGGHLFPAFDLSTAYAESDVLVSLAKLKQHDTAGITLSMKNCFGCSPTTIYGDKLPKDEPSPVPYGGRNEIGHRGTRQPPSSAPAEKDPTSPREAGYRIPRFVADMVAALPIHLAIVDGVETIAGAELPRAGYTRMVSPGVLLAGTNCVTTDAVGAAVMGFDPMADRGTAPFAGCDSTLKLAEALGVGTRDLKQIEVIGVPVQQGSSAFEHSTAPGGARER
jgi:uncharacterized protein (DUF362 family)